MHNALIYKSLFVFQEIPQVFVYQRFTKGKTTSDIEKTTSDVGKTMSDVVFKVSDIFFRGNYMDVYLNVHADFVNMA